MMKYFGKKSTLESTHYENLDDLVTAAIEFALENGSYEGGWRSRAWMLANQFCEREDDRMQVKK